MFVVFVFGFVFVCVCVVFTTRFCSLEFGLTVAVVFVTVAFLVAIVDVRGR